MALWMEESWSVEDWLKGGGMDQYTTEFLDNGYDTESLCANLKDEDLNVIGVSKREHRKLFFHLSERLRDEKNKGGRAKGGASGPPVKNPTVTDPIPGNYSEVWGSQPNKKQKKVKKDKSGEEPKHKRPVAGSGGGKLNGTVSGRAEKDDEDGTAAGRKKVHPSDGRSKKKRSGNLAQPPPEHIPATPGTAPGSHSHRGASTRQRSPGPNSSSQPPTPVSSGPHEHDEKPFLTKLQLKLKIRDELQRMRIILTEPPYTMVRRGEVKEGEGGG